MDVAVFVGFASKGPWHKPVAVEDFNQFTTRFGGPVTLVRDAASGQPILGQLRPAVRSFFRNGGLRCWIIRVPKPAAPTRSSREIPPIEASIFLDDDLANTPAASLMAQADFIRYESARARPLGGIHAALAIDEATLIAVPDAALPRWGRRVAEPLRAPTPMPAAARPDDRFDSCEVGPPPPPDPMVRRTAESGTFALIWAPVDGATRYTVETLREPGSRRGPSQAKARKPVFHVAEAESGSYTFRVRSIGPGGFGVWSAPLRVVVNATPSYALESGVPDRSEVVLLHAALLRMCAARGDMFAILSMPQNISSSDALDHVADVRRAVTGTTRDLSTGLARDSDPSNVLSFGALFHPWLLTIAPEDQSSARVSAASTSAVRKPIAGLQPPLAQPVPADGAVAGVFAARAEERGAWIAPANVELKDIVGTARPLTDDDLVALHRGQVNVIRPTPSGFRTLATHSLSLDGTFRPLTVRRLLALLRRLALLHGVDYVFEPNDNGFRRRIQRGFEVLLAALFERGAFAGSRASDGYRVEVGDPPNSRQSVDAGRLIVELKVAPSTPLEFLTVRLVRSGERLAVEGV